MAACALWEAMMHIYFKMGNISFPILHFLCVKFVSLPCPWHAPVVSMPYLCIIGRKPFNCFLCSFLEPFKQLGFISMLSLVRWHGRVVILRTSHGSVWINVDSGSALLQILCLGMLHTSSWLARYWRFRLDIKKCLFI